MSDTEPEDFVSVLAEQVAIVQIMEQAELIIGTLAAGEVCADAIRKGSIVTDKPGGSELIESFIATGEAMRLFIDQNRPAIEDEVRASLIPNN